MRDNNTGEHITECNHYYDCNRNHLKCKECINLQDCIDEPICPEDKTYGNDCESCFNFWKCSGI